MDNYIYADEAVNRKKLEEALDEIMDNFDFEKVANIMNYLGWKWASVDTEDNIPTEDDIREHAAKLLWDVCNDPENNIHATGGFEAEKDFSDPNKPFVSLRFILESYDGGEF